MSRIIRRSHYKQCLVRVGRGDAARTKSGYATEDSSGGANKASSSTVSGSPSPTLVLVIVSQTTVSTETLYTSEDEIMLTDESLPFHLYRKAPRRDNLYTYIQTTKRPQLIFPGSIPLLRRIGYQNLSEFSRKYNAKEQPNSNNENKVVIC